MVFKNPIMSKYLISNKDKIIKETLDKNLKDILEEGFVSIGECVFFSKFYPSEYDFKSIDKEEIKDQFLDYSGYEYFTNKFHIGDFTDKDPFVQSILFCSKLRESLSDEFINLNFVIVFSFQDDEIGRFSHFSFHKKREGEMIYDDSAINSVDLMNRPMYVEVIESKN